MKILGLETSSAGHGSIAVLDANQLLLEVELDAARRTAGILIPTVQAALQEVGWMANELELIAVSIGPGSFTGLRIAVTTAKVMAYASGSEVIGVNSLEAAALQANGVTGEVIAVMDAQRNELFVARFDREDDQAAVTNLETTKIVSLDLWRKSLKPTATVTGPALNRLVGSISPDQPTASASDWHPRAGTLGLLGWQKFTAGDRDDLWQLKPMYYRQSAAEEKLDQRS